MFRPVARALARAPAVAARSPASTRLISTAGPTSKSRSWKNTFVRLGLAGGAIYYYNTSSAFAQEPSCMSCRRLILVFLPHPRCKTRILSHKWINAYLGFWNVANLIVYV
jgi:hypothetical protein